MSGGKNRTQFSRDYAALLKTLCLVKSFVTAFVAAAAFALPAYGAELVVNGGFETGSLSGWTSSGLTVAGSCGAGLNATDWTVSNSGAATNCVDPGVPPQGTYAAYNMFDAGAPLTYRLRQTVALPAGLTAATLQWRDSINGNFSPPPRVFAVNILNSAGNVVLGNLHTFSTSGPVNTGWLTHTVNATSLLSPLAGQQVILEFAVDITAAWTGSAGMGLDAVSLDVVAPPTPIPTLSEWGMIVLSSMLALSALLVMRRRQR